MGHMIWFFPPIQHLIIFISWNTDVGTYRLDSRTGHAHTAHVPVGCRNYSGPRSAAGCCPASDRYAWPERTRPRLGGDGTARLGCVVLLHCLTIKRVCPILILRTHHCSWILLVPPILTTSDTWNTRFTATSQPRLLTLWGCGYLYPGDLLHVDMKCVITQASCTRNYNKQ